MTTRSRWTVVLGLALLPLAEARAGLGRRLGEPLGDFLDGVLRPPLLSVSGELGERVDQVDVAVNGVITHTDQVVEARVDQVNWAVAERIAQVDLAVGRTVARTNDALEERLDQAIAGGRVVVADVNAAARARLADVDRSLEARIGQVDAATEARLAQLDHIAEERVDQVDAAAGRRLGNVDVITSKQLERVETLLSRVGTLLAGLVVAVIWAVPIVNDHRFPHAQVDAAQDCRGKAREVVAGLLRALPWYGWRTLGIGALAAALWFLSGRIGQRYETVVARLRDVHEASLADAVRALDLEGARYAVAQLEILDPERTGAHRRALRKVEVLGAVLGANRSDAEVRAELAALERTWSGTTDPDVLTAEGLLGWRTATTRQDQRDAVARCRTALELAPAFPLRELAVHCRELAAVDDAARDGRAATLRPADPRLAGAAAYDQLLASLRATADPAWIRLLEAQAAVARAGRSASKELLAQRTAAATAVVDAWTRFDEALAVAPGVSGTPTERAVLLLDDAPATQARWYLAHPADPKSAPRVSEVRDAAERARLLPPRVEWARRTLDDHPAAADLLGWAEARRFAVFEARAVRVQEDWITSDAKGRCAAAAAGYWASSWDPEAPCASGRKLGEEGLLGPAADYL